MDIEPSKFCQLDAKDNQLSEINWLWIPEESELKGQLNPGTP